MMKRIIKSLACCFTLVALSVSLVQAKVLPEEGAEVLYHRYQGGGMTIDGPAVLVRKNFGNTLSVSAHHYIDSIIGASIDVEALGASEYTEERTENTVGIDLLRRKTLFGLYVTESLENDYDARFYSASISQDFFGDLTSVSLGFSRGFNVIGKTGSPEFEKANDSRKYTLGVTQIITKHFIMNFAMDGSTDEGYMQNPYRMARTFENNDDGFSWIPENYPATRTSTAASIRGVYYLPYRASILSEIRLFTDSWGIQSQNFKIAYRHTKDDQWIFEGRLRFYSQDHADFYSDLFINPKNFMGRDKELSTFSTLSFGFTATYEYEMSKIGFLEGATLVFSFERIALNFDDFRDASVDGITGGSEPFYSFNANVYRLVYNLHY